MKTPSNVKGALLFTSSALLISCAVVSLSNKVLRYSTQLVLTGSAIAYIEQLKAKRKATKEDRDILIIKLNAVHQQLQLSKEETRSLVQYTDEEFQQYQEAVEAANIQRDNAEQEKDELQLQLWALEEKTSRDEEQLNRPRLSLVKSLAPSSPEAQNLEPSVETTSLPKSSPTETASLEATPNVNLSNYRIAIVGGHRKVCRRVKAHLRSKYNLTKARHIPSQREKSIDYSRLHSKLEKCDLIVLMTDYMGHPLKKMVLDLKSKGSTGGHILYINTTGFSSINREINAYIDRTWLHTA